VSRTTGPYVGLDYFLEEDAGIFFGRDAERKRIIGNLRASRLTLLYAESGVGKSSLLRAGVSARLRQLAERPVEERDSVHYLPVVISAWRGDSKTASITALEAAVRPLLDEDGELALRRDTLEHAIEDVVTAADVTVLLILDQFEEHFLYEPGDEEGFDDELARCVNRGDLRAHFLISVREDAYSLIGDRFKARIPNVYGNYLHLDFLDESAARAAVLEPVNAFNRQLASDSEHFEVEPELVDAVLEEVRRGQVVIGGDSAREVVPTGPVRVETAYLQLVMKRLWDEEIAAGSQRLRVETLRRLGGADTIVRAHLDDVLAQLPVDQRDSAATAFRFLVTSSGRKIALSSEELREFSDGAGDSMEPALEHLERERILRPIPQSEPGAVARREIYHDVLAPAVVDWRRRHVEQRRREESERRLAEAGERARRLEVRNRRLAAAVIALAGVAVALALYLWNPEPVQRADLQTVDVRFSVRGPQDPDQHLVLIAVDNKTVARLHPPGNGPLIPRQYYTRILNRLRGDRPDVIALDVIFEGAQDPRVDRELLDAIDATSTRLVLPFAAFSIVTVDNVGEMQDVLGGVSYPASKAQVVSAAESNQVSQESIEMLEDIERDRFKDPVEILKALGGPLQTVRPDLFGRPEALEATGVRTGFAGLPEDEDDGNRRTDYEVTTTGSLSAQTFAFAAADLARHGALRAQDLPTAPHRTVDEQSDSTTWIDYRGPSGTVRRVSALDVLDGRVAPGTFREKRVVVGVTAPVTADVHDTPFDRMRGPEVQANAVDTILKGAPMRDVPQLVDFLAILLLAAVPPAAMLIRRRWLAVAAVVAAALLFLVIVQIAFSAGWIVGVVAPLVGLLVASLVATGLGAAAALRAQRPATPGSGTN
jgi:CHASE2 domain-containing sensor protein